MIDERIFTNNNERIQRIMIDVKNQPVSPSETKKKKPLMIFPADKKTFYEDKEIKRKSSRKNISRKKSKS